MINEIQLNNQIVQYTLKTSSRAKNLRLAIYCDGSLVVTRPQYLGSFFVNNFLRERANWILSKIEYFKKFGRLRAVADPKEYRQNKKAALILVRELVANYNSIYGFKYNALKIKNQKTRWGSCSKKGNLNFSYKIAFMPRELAEYIVAHEICHLQEFNHAAKFWNLVGKTIPDYAQLRKKLRKWGRN
ncbi:MAG: M48 family metallopeptidase [Candidatus Parcubacteria bacterium]|nr:M48 family metallopeptidase [Candidatus Parcubacteria bacterium]